MMLHRSSRFLFSLVALLPTIAWTLPSDSSKPINIEADHAQLNDSSGITQYKGNAVLTQGTLRIEGDVITFHYNGQKQLTKIVAQGELARYQQLQNLGEEPVNARALKMEYHAAAEKIYLFGRGQISQSADEFNGNRIEYDIKRNIVNAYAKPAVNVHKKGEAEEQVHIIIDPNAQRANSRPKEEPAKTKQKQLTSQTKVIRSLKENNAENTFYPMAHTLTKLNIRSGPGEQYPKLATFENNRELVVLTQQNEWVQVRGKSNQQVVIGWVHGSFVSTTNFN
jgi:lipopolysaccharide export system protein LptA